MAKRKKRGVVGPMEALAIIAKRDDQSAPVEPDEPRPYSPDEIRAIAARIPELDRTPNAVMWDRILLEYWMMAKPDKAEMLRQYRSLCTSGLSVPWVRHHCEIAAFLEALLSRQ